MATLAATPLIVAPASAQFFDRIFRDEPPRPPRDVPPPPDQVQRPPADAQRPTFQTLRPPVQQQQAPAPGEWQNPDLLPQSQRQPANVAPGVTPGGAQPGGPQQGGVQSQPLAPPPGTAPGDQQPLRGSQDAALPPAQGQGQGQPQQGQTPPPAEPPTDEVVVAPPEQKIVNPTAVFTGLDKITGRTITFDVAINETVQFGALQVTPRVCYSRPPTETQNTDSFVKVDEVTLQGDVKQIFSGWMFASSPGLNAVEHPIYDVWLIDCKGGANATAEAEPAAGANAGDDKKAPVPRPPQRPQRRAQPAQPAQPGFLPALR
ncbi:MAG: DUF2155 domain-containing protein [Pseudolabrys sp.]